jgi:hypothetical protein
MEHVKERLFSCDICGNECRNIVFLLKIFLTNRNRFRICFLMLRINRGVNCICHRLM